MVIIEKRLCTMQPFIDFFNIVFDFSFVAELLAMSFSIPWIFCPPKKDWKSILLFCLKMIGLFGCGILINLLVFVIADYWAFLAGLNFPISYFIVTLSFMLIFCKYNWQSKVMMFATFYSCEILINEFASSIQKFVYGTNAIEYIRIPFFILIVLMALLMRKLTLHHFHDIPLVSVVLILVTSVCGTVFVYSYIKYAMKNDVSDFVPISLSLILLYLIILTSYVSVYFLCREREKVIVLESEKRMLVFDKNMMQISQKTMNDLKKVRHDFKNQLTTMNLMLEQGDYDGLKQYFDEMSASLSPSLNMFSCSQKGISTIINIEMYKANDLNIPLDVHVAIPEILPISDYDLCSVITNMIDNALEYINRNKMKAQVKVDIVLKGAGLYISVSNPLLPNFNKESLKKMNSSKNDTRNHGLGHIIIQSVCEKYNGYAAFTVEDSTFLAMALLNMSKEKE